MVATTVKVEFDREALAALCRNHRIKRLTFFGSVLRDDFRPESDVDLLYEFEEGKTPCLGILDVMGDFEAFFGRKVDLVSFKYIKPRLRVRILAEAQIEYEAS